MIVLLFLILAWTKRLIERGDSTTTFIASLATVPIVLFNQQVLTGRSLQPIHYEQFIANYIALLVLILTVALLVRRRIRPNSRVLVLTLVCVAGVSLGYGASQAKLATRSRISTVVDEFMPVALRLKDLASIQKDSDPSTVLVLDPMFQLSDALPTVAPQAVLWAPHSYAFSTLTAAENKERYFQQLYYCSAKPESEEQFSYSRIVFRQVIFGWDRAIPGLSASSRPITIDEERIAFRDYETYVNTFDSDRAAHPTLSFVVLSATSRIDLSRVDHWYERDEGERIGNFILYRVRLRP
jgi:hypothetical protein